MDDEDNNPTVEEVCRHILDSESAQRAAQPTSVTSDVDEPESDSTEVATLAPLPELVSHCVDPGWDMGHWKFGTSRRCRLGPGPTFISGQYSIKVT
ncbi:hypothetical protein FRC12_020180, partial [Ceratobasidium sp. 428]